MSKNIYEILNDVEINLDEIEEMDEMEKMRYKKNFKNRNKKNKPYKKFVVAAALIVSLGLGSQTSLGQDVYAKAQSKLDDIGYSLSWAMDKDRELDSYSNVIDQEIEDRGVTVKLSHVIVDRDSLIISSLIDTSGLDEEVNNFDMDTKVYIDGKKVDVPAASGSLGRLEEDENIFFQIQDLDMEGIDLEKDMDMRIVLTARKGLKGQWEYNFKANGRELSENTQSYKLSYSFNIGDENYSLDELSYNPVSKKIHGEYKGEDKLGHNIILKGLDDKGNDVTFELKRKIGSRLVFESQDELDDSVEFIRLRPYGAEYSRENGRENTDYSLVGDEFKIDLR